MRRKQELLAISGACRQTLSKGRGECCTAQKQIRCIIENNLRAKINVGNVYKA